MFLNLSNHSSSLWCEEQRKQAMEYGEIVDFPFPSVPAEMDEKEVARLAEQLLEKIEKWDVKAAMVQGEFTLTYRLVNALKEKGIHVVAACSNRNVVENIGEDGTLRKEAVFEFLRFREYT